MFEWVLILTFYAGAMSKGDSVAMVTITGFSEEAECIKAGKDSKALETMMKSTNFVCVKRKKV